MSQAIADLLFPDVPNQLSVPAPRSLPPDAVITRFAPSPTGFVHIGSIYIALVGRMLTTQSGGVFILRIEDTDQAREVERGVEEIVSSLHAYEIVPDEGPYAVEPLRVRGDYGPYVQSERRAIYHYYAKQLVAEGRAYPSFESPERLDAIRTEQREAKLPTGYYGKWATDRHLSRDEVAEKLEAGQTFVIRINAETDERPIEIEDAVRGTLQMPANFLDFVLLKQDGLPTYHFAHPIDDTLMGINLILRADEWLSTLPLHVQLFHALRFPLPTFAHIAPIGKQDGSTRRKLSKRKDPESAVSYYASKGYPREAVIDYLLNIVNSAFEEWRAEHWDANAFDYPLRLDKMSGSLSLFDLQKLDSVSQETVARLSADEVYERVAAWAAEHAPATYELVTADPQYSKRVLSLGRADQSRKDIVTWSDVDELYGFFFDTRYSESVAREGYQLPSVPQDAAASFLTNCAQDPGLDRPKEAWLEQMREYASEANFALKRRAYKENPEAYSGLFGHAMGLLRVSLTNRPHSPDLYDIMQIMGEARVRQRVADTIAAIQQV